MHRWLYVLACVLVPLAWGVLSTIAMRWVERRLQVRSPASTAAEEGPPEAMWYI